jgi:hypothetical protein
MELGHKRKYNYTQYIIGLDFYLWEKKLGR